MTNHDSPLSAEQRARQLIDEQLIDAGWAVQDRSQLNLYAGQGVAVREAIMAPGHGRVDYLLYVDRAVVGLIEAKPEGTALTGVEWQSTMYATGLPKDVRLAAKTVDEHIPFVIEANGRETHLTNGYDPQPRSRPIFRVPQPATLAAILRQVEEYPDAPTWRGRVTRLAALDTDRLRPAQIEAIGGIERSLAEQRFGRSLVQMATGAGKTFTAVTLCQRLLRYGGFRRLLFLVDRNNLGDQALAEFQNYRLPGDGRRFTEVWNADKLTTAGQLGSSSVVISTIQRVYAALRGDPVPDGDAPDLDADVPAAPVTVGYDAAMPPEAFDLVIVDEAHRSIYGVWREVVEQHSWRIPSASTCACCRSTRHTSPSASAAPTAGRRGPVRPRSRSRPTTALHRRTCWTRPWPRAALPWRWSCSRGPSRCRPGTSSASSCGCWPRWATAGRGPWSTPGSQGTPASTGSSARTRWGSTASTCRPNATPWTSRCSGPVQGFVGALMGAQAHRVNARIELIDGARLVALMIDHGVGVQAEMTVTLHRLDEDFFEGL